MCQTKSAIILKDRIFVPDYNGHTEMLNELGIRDDYFGMTKIFVRAELTPREGDVFTPVDSWAFRVDQDETPEWFNEDVHRPLMIEAVKKWAQARIFVNADKLNLSSGENYYLKDCKRVTLSGDVKVTVCDNTGIDLMRDNASIADMYGNTIAVRVQDNASITTMRDKAEIIRMHGRAAIANMHGHATISGMYDDATIGGMYAYSKILEMRDRATIHFMSGRTSIVEMSGDARIYNMCEKARITEMHGRASIDSMYGVSGEARVAKMYGYTKLTISEAFPESAKAESIALHDNAIIIDERTKTFYTNSHWKVSRTKEAITSEEEAADEARKIDCDFISETSLANLIESYGVDATKGAINYAIKCNYKRYPYVRALLDKYRTCLDL